MTADQAMRRQIFYPYLIAVAAVLLAALFRASMLGSWMGDQAPLGLFTMAILLSAWMGGLLPGLFATALSMAIGSLLFIAPYTFTPAHTMILAIFLINGSLISLVCGSLRQSRRKAEAAREEVEIGQLKLRESEDRFRQLADSAPVLIWMWDVFGECVWFNRSWLGFTGRLMEQETGHRWLEGVHPEDREHCSKTYAKSFHARQPFEMDYRLKRHDDVYRWIMARGIPLSGAKGEFLGYIGSAVDINERKQAEDNRAELLQIEQTARFEAERTAMLKDEFLAIVSHEMRTPLTAILGWVQLLRNGSLPPATVPQALETIERNARAQAKLIDDLLDMSRVLSGRLRLDVHPVSPSETVEAAIAAAEPSAAAKNIHLTSRLDSKGGMVSGDPGRLQQIVLNLLSNAIKFTPSGGQVTVCVSHFANEVEISVSDTGEGIKPEFLPHVFDRFRQQDASTIRKHPGLGLGLSTAKQLVELHGGSVRAESQGPDKGATFVVSLPLMAEGKEKPAGKPAARLETDSIGEALPSLLRTKILVVDDDSDAREVLRSILAQNGASVRTAGSASEAVKEFEMRRPDVLVSDIGMPGEDGYALIRSIRILDQKAGGLTPAIALTAFTRSDDRRRAIGAGFQIHLSKPIEAAELVTVVASLVKS